MRKVFVLPLFLFFAFSAFAYPLNSVLLKNFNTVMALARYEQKDAIIVFSDPSCFYCNKLKSDTLSNLQVQQILSNNFLIGEIYATNEKANFEGNVYTYSDLFQGFRVTGTPTLVFFTSEGTPLTYLPGYLGPSDFIKVLQYVALGAYSKNIDFGTFSKTPNNFVGTPTVISVTQDEANYILQNDPMAKKIDSYPGKDADHFLKYVVFGKDATSIADKMISDGFYNVYVVG